MASDTTPSASASYNPKACCNSDCWAYEMYDDEPCWGDVEVIDEQKGAGGDYYWVHSCQGHLRKMDYGTYEPEPAAP